MKGRNQKPRIRKSDRAMWKTRIAYFMSMFAVVWLLSGCESGPKVEAVSPHRGEIKESFTEPAKTRLEKTYRITMPMSGRIGRIELEPGDRVTSGQQLMQFDLVPLKEAVAEARAAVAELEAKITVTDDDRIENTALIEMNATVDAAAEALNAADAQVKAEQARSDRAAKELGRMEKLAAERTIPQTALDDAQLEAETSLIELRKQEFYRAALNALFVAVKLGPRYVNEYLGREKLERNVTVHQLAQARSRLARAEHQLKLTDIRAPINGVVLEKYEQGDRTLPAGSDLLLLGNLDELEVIADVLTQDALRLSPDSRVRLQAASRIESIPGVVKRIEPAGFTKLSSLGVEQQRVNVIVSFAGEHENLGVGYRLMATFFTGSKDNALIVPRYSVLQAPDQSFYVLKIVNGKIHEQLVELGLRSDLELEVTDGLSEKDVIVAKPDATMKEGMKVKIVR
jgi:HlyD family secretion protein